MKTKYKIKLFLIAFIFIFSLFRLPALAACREDVLQGVLNNIKSCVKNEAQSEESCIQDYYYPACYKSLSSGTQQEKEKICADETSDCVQEHKDAKDEEDENNLNDREDEGNKDDQKQGNCDKGFVEINKICVPKGDYNQNSLAGATTWQELSLMIIKYLLYFIGIVAVIAIMVGGYLYIASGGNEEQAEKGRKVLVNAVIGVMAVILAYTIVTVVTNLLVAGIK